MSFNLALISQDEMKACGQWKRLPADYGCSAGLGENISAFHSDTYMSVPTRDGFFFQLHDLTLIRAISIADIC